MIVTNTLTSVEGHVLRLGGVLRTRKIFVGCPAIRPIWDQSPGIRNRPGLRLLVTGSIHYTIKIASAVSRRRRKSKIVHAQRPDQIPPRAFHASPTPPQPQPIHRIKQERASGRDFSKTYFLWMSTDSMTSPCSMARTTSMPLVTLPKTAWQEVPRTSQGFS